MASIAIIQVALSLQNFVRQKSKERYIIMGFTEIGVVLFLVALLAFGFLNSRKVSQELKKLGADK